jgi:hypothetical protein
MKSRNKRDLEKHWSEQTKKTGSQPTARSRAPKKGDRVGVNGRNGVFAVVAVQRIPNIVDLQPLKGGPVEKSIPWTVLTFMDEENASQTADRLAREAAEEGN